MLVCNEPPTVREITKNEFNVANVNSIKDKYPAQRQYSKMPTFALTYQGTYLTLMAKGGFTEQVARQIEKNYHELYKESDAWLAGHIDEASKNGYATAAFGLRIRTPLLHQVILGTQVTPSEAEQEARTLGNAIGGQSWCLLNTRAKMEFMRKVRASDYRLLIRPIADIHDAQYYLIPDNLDVLLYVNKHLVEAVRWQDHPDIQHDEVKLGGQLSIFHPSWAHEIPIPNEADGEKVLDTIAEALNERESQLEAA